MEHAWSTFSTTVHIPVRGYEEWPGTRDNTFLWIWIWIVFITSLVYLLHPCIQCWSFDEEWFHLLCPSTEVIVINYITLDIQGIHHLTLKYSILILEVSLMGSIYLHTPLCSNLSLSCIDSHLSYYITGNSSFLSIVRRGTWQHQYVLYSIRSLTCKLIEYYYGRFPLHSLGNKFCHSSLIGSRHD